MNVSKWVRPGAWAALLCGCVAGCSSEPVTGFVRGRVTVDGQPVPNVSVYIWNTVSQECVNTRTNDGGEYEVKSHKDRGLPPGSYTVAVRPATELKSDEEAIERMKSRLGQKNPWANTKPKPVASVIPKRYYDPKTSGLKIDVAPGENPAYDFNLAGK